MRIRGIGVVAVFAALSIAGCCCQVQPDGRKCAPPTQGFPSWPDFTPCMGMETVQTLVDGIRTDAPVGNVWDDVRTSVTNCLNQTGTHRHNSMASDPRVVWAHLLIAHHIVHHLASYADPHLLCMQELEHPDHTQ